MNERERHGQMTFVNRGGKRAAASPTELENQHRSLDTMKIRKERPTRTGDRDGDRRQPPEHMGPSIRSSRV